jgi:hypothetical protein
VESVAFCVVAFGLFGFGIMPRVTFGVIGFGCFGVDTPPDRHVALGVVGFRCLGVGVA